MKVSDEHPPFRVDRSVERSTRISLPNFRPNVKRIRPNRAAGVHFENRCPCAARMGRQLSGDRRIFPRPHTLVDWGCGLRICAPRPIRIRDLQSSTGKLGDGRWSCMSRSRPWVDAIVDNVWTSWRRVGHSLSTSGGMLQPACPPGRHLRSQ